jgi:hypothetical protein
MDVCVSKTTRTFVAFEVSFLQNLIFFLGKMELGKQSLGFYPKFINFSSL